MTIVNSSTIADRGTKSLTIDLDYGASREVIDKNEHIATGVIASSKQITLDLAGITWHELSGSSVDWSTELTGPNISDVPNVTCSSAAPAALSHTVTFKVSDIWVNSAVNSAEDNTSTTWYAKIPVTIGGSERKVHIGAIYTLTGAAATVTFAWDS